MGGEFVRIRESLDFHVAGAGVIRTVLAMACVRSVAEALPCCRAIAITLQTPHAGAATRSPTSLLFRCHAAVGV